MLPQASRYIHRAVFPRFCRNSEKNSEKYVRVIKCCTESCQTNDGLAIRDFWQIFRAFKALFKRKCVSLHFLPFISSAAQKMSILCRVLINCYIFCSHAIIAGHAIGKFSRSLLGKEWKIEKKTDFLLRTPTLQCVLLALSYWSKCVSQTDATRDPVKGTTLTAIFFGTELKIRFIGVTFPNIKSHVQGQKPSK